MVKSVETRVAQGAVAIWQKFYGKPRASGRDNRLVRRDRGCPRLTTSHEARKKPSVAGWLREQSAKIGRCAKALARRRGAAPAPAPDVSVADLWTAKHDAEIRFVKDFSYKYHIKFLCSRYHAGKWG